VVPHGVSTLDAPLPTFANRLAIRGPVTIVILGSSADDATGPAASEFQRVGLLQAELSRRWPGVEFEVVKKGLYGHRAADMLDSVVDEVAAMQPALVIWQAGAAAAAHDTGLERLREEMVQGLERLSKTGADVVVMDLQFVPRWDDHPRQHAYLSLIRTVAAEEGAGVFKRYDVMKTLAGVAPKHAGRGEGRKRCVAQILAEAIASGVLAAAMR
jgi:acyl-CoA thioesterase I